MIKQIIVPLVLVFGLGSGTVFATEAPTANPAQPAEMANPFASMGMMNAGVPNPQHMNLARPQGYQVFINPMNYGQFMNPNAWTGMMTPQAQLQPQQQPQQ